MIEEISYNDSERFRIDECIKNFLPKECVTSEEASSWSIILEGYLSYPNNNRPNSNDGAQH